jgi:DNA-binding NtrC family response regulator
MAPFAAPASGAPRPSPTTPAGANGEFLTLSEIEKQHILAALQRSKGNRTHAARMLSISIRTLRNKLNEYNFKGSPEARASTTETEDAAA